MAETHPFFGQFQLFLLRVEDVLCGLYLSVNSGLGDGGGDDIGHQVQPGTCQLVALIIDAGGQCFQSAPIAAGQIKGVINAHPGIVKTEFPGVTGQA